MSSPLPLLPIRSVRLRFRFTAQARLRFFHQPLVGGLARYLMDGRLEDQPRLWIDTPESGRVPFARGDAYQIQLWCCAGGETLLETLVDRLRRLPESLPRGARELSLGDNLRFDSATDAFTNKRYEGVSRLFGYDDDALARELDFYLASPPAAMQLLSPIRWKRADAAERKQDDRYIHDRGELLAKTARGVAGGLLGERIDDGLNSLLRAVGAATEPRGEPRVLATDDDIGWFDAYYRNAEGGGKSMGGIVGRIDIAVRDPAGLPALVLGQYTGIGERRTFGWGRYRLETADGRGTIPARRPSLSVLERAATPANVELAYRSIRANATGGAPPQLDPFEDDIAALAWAEHSGPVDELLEEVTAGLRAAIGGNPARDRSASDTPDMGIPAPPGARRPCQAAPLRGWILQRKGKSPRPLAVPPFAERIAQRAVLQILRTDVEPLLSDASFGYRRGLSREQARDRLQYLYRQGYQWLYEADIDDFFDSVPRTRLATRLRSLLPDEPAVDQIMAWVAAPVKYRGRMIERPTGLPQGAPISPLLANLLLDDFDADLRMLGFELVRFADDFVVACRSRADAEAAARRVRQSLAELDLHLNEAKSGITHFDRGFRFLGYSFLGDMAVDGATGAARVQGPLRIEDLPPASWLARLARREPAILDDAPLPSEPARDRGGPPPDTLTAVHLRAPDVGADEPCTLLVATEGSLISTTQGRLRIVMPNDEIHEQPLATLGAVLLLGRQRITMPTLTAALDAGVPIHFASRSGRYRGVLSNQHPGPDGAGLWLRQRASFVNPDFAVPLAREIVATRIHDQIQVLRQRARVTPLLDDAVAALKRLAPRVSGATALTELNGLEGTAASRYFQALAGILPAEFGFSTRRRRPPPDPFNSLLSLGYTLLYQRADTVLRAAGLLPAQGFYHQGRGRHAALASDLMECFRHIVERQALAMIGRGELTPADFLLDDRQGCRLSRDALRSYLPALSRRFIAEMEDDATGERGSLHDHLWRMARALIAQINGQQADFRGFRVK